MPDFSYHRRSYHLWTFRTMDDSYHGLFVPSLDFSFRLRILVSSTFLSRVSKVAIKVVGLRREHRARLLNRKDDHDDQAAADDDDDYDDDADAIPTFTTMSPFQSVAVLAFLYYFDAVFVCRRRIPTTVRKVQGRYDKSMVRNVYGTKSLVPKP